MGIIRDLAGEILIQIGRRVQNKPKPPLQAPSVPESFQTDKRYHGPLDGFPESLPGDNAAWAAEQADLLRNSPDKVDPDYYKYIEVTGGL
mgnify:CR=1 FL=1